MSETKVLLPVGGALTGTGTYATIGGMGLVGGFGGIGLGLGAMTGIGAVTGTALYGGIHALQTGDSTAYLATGLGSLAGVGLYNTIGGVGLGVGGTAFGLGMGAMAVSGGVIGLGIYGLAKMLNITSSPESFGETYTRMEEKMSYQEAYNEAMMEIDPTLAELSWKQKWAEIEIEDELNELKKNLAGNIDYTRLNKIRLLKEKREALMTQLKQTYSSSRKYNLLKEIDEIERQIKENSLFK